MKLLVCLLSLTSASALLVAPLAPRLEARSVAMSASTRRAHLQQVGQVAAMAALTVPLAARADAIEDIAAKANAKAKAQREEALSAPPPVEQTDEEKLQPIIGALAASVVLSVPFFAENLKRLGTKISTGEDPRKAAAAKAAKATKKRR